MPTLALLFHLIAWADSIIKTAPLPTLKPVSILAAELAVSWCAFLEAHARKVYAGIIQSEVAAAQALGEKIKNGKVRSGHPLRVIYRAGWARLQTRESVAAAIQILSEAGWCRLVTDETGGRPTDILRLNPRLEVQK